jgi:hypothetical protein
VAFRAPKGAGRAPLDRRRVPRRRLHQRRHLEILGAHFAERQLIEPFMLIGEPHLVAFTLNALGVQREAGVPGLE